MIFFIPIIFKYMVKYLNITKPRYTYFANALALRYIDVSLYALFFQWWSPAPSSFDELRLHIERFTNVASIYANLLKQKKSIYMRKEFNSQRIFLVHQHGCRFIVLEHQYGLPWRHVKTLYKRKFEIHSRGQHPCWFIWTKESIYMRKEFNSQRIFLVHQHGLRFIVFKHQYGCRDAMWKSSIHLRRIVTWPTN